MCQLKIDELNSRLNMVIQQGEPMMKCNVRTVEQAFAYIADCNLATVSRMAMLKSRKKGEFERQIAIAQTMCDWMKDFKIDPRGTRAEEIVGIKSVNDWVSKYIV